VAQIGDGWLASGTVTPDEFGSSWAAIQDHCDRLGRDPAAIEPAKFIYVHLDRDRGRALSILRLALTAYYPFPYDVERTCLYGTPDECAPLARRVPWTGTGLQRGRSGRISRWSGARQAVEGAA
jgi:alkanesulfonate monooxygenase SsuD/methylene tetrahydromethanopterin reductase-like flavin-dependent oxidoreductase (luciferase family)